jgi:hypothetical protein
MAVFISFIISLLHAFPPKKKGGMGRGTVIFQGCISTNICIPLLGPECTLITAVHTGNTAISQLEIS